MSIVSTNNKQVVVKSFEFNTIFLPLVLLGVTSAVFLLITLYLWNFGTVEANSLNFCETTQSSNIPRAQTDGGSGTNPLRINDVNECQSFL